MSVKIRRQRPLKGGRDPLPSCVDPKVREAVLETTKRFRCSRSFVVAVALHDFFNIKVQDDYRDEVTKRRNRRSA